MGAALRLLVVLVTIATKWREYWLITACILASFTIGTPKPALAECSGSPDNVICTSGGNFYSIAAPGTPYQPVAGGINVGGNPPDPLGLTLKPGVQVVILSGGTRDAVNAANEAGCPCPAGMPVTILATDVTIDNTKNASDPFGNYTGLRIQSAGSATIMATNVSIDVAGTASEDAIVAFVQGDNPPGAGATAGVFWSGNHLTSGGTESTGIQADNRGNGDAVIDASGDVTGIVGKGHDSFFGLIAHAGDSTFVSSPGAGNATVAYHTGTIDVSGNRPRGIVVWAEGDGSAKLITDPGTIIKVSGKDPGDTVPTQFVKAAIALELDSATAAEGVLTADVASVITDFGPTTPSVNDPDFGTSVPIGIVARSFGGSSSSQSAPITVTYTGKGITTEGGGGVGIEAESVSGSINVVSSGPIDTTGGLGAVGILADSGTLLARSGGVLDSGRILTKGSVSPTATTGAVEVDTSNMVFAQGKFATGISATGGDGGVTVKILPGGAVMGGWQQEPPQLSDVGPVFPLPPATGVNLGSTGGIATLVNDGSIGALSDRAITGDPQVTNNGIITGFVQFGGSGNSILNNGIFDLRHFADTDGDGVRDTIRVAISDLGLANDSFSNKGILALAPVSGATALDNTGEYLPLGNPHNATALGGPLQGQMIGVTTFINSGVIDLQQNPIAGDVLVITGARTAGVAGPGTYVSDGGALKLNTVLNKGGVATRSDTLVVDGTSVGAGGATKTFIRNAGGAGALTVGDGILVVEVKDPSRSAKGAFTLGNVVAAGPYDYGLFHGGVKVRYYKGCIDDTVVHFSALRRLVR